MPHPHMIFDIDECEQYSSQPEKTTVIVTSGPAPINFLMWNVFSFLLRSKMNDFMEHITVCLSGPDKRTGDPTLQDNKQKFLEELRDMKWRKLDGQQKDMPLTLIRAWSRIGADQSVEMGAAWCHTDSYLLTHDDSILLAEGWEADVMDKLYSDPKVATVYYEPQLQGMFSSERHQERWKLNIPHLNSVFFMAVKKAAIAKAGVRWAGFHFQKDFDLKQMASVPELFDHYKDYIVNPPQTENNYGFVSMDFGAWMHYRLTQAGYYGVPFDRQWVHHFGSASWGGEDWVKRQTSRAATYIEQLETELQQYPEYWSLYNKYKANL